MSKIYFREASLTNCNKINYLVRSSKATWKYSAYFLSEFMSLYAISEEQIHEDIVVVLMVDSTIAGVLSLKEISRTKAELFHFFTGRKFQRLGYGKLMWDKCISIAQENGYEEIELISDPNATDFYLKQGCHHLYSSPSPLDPDRELPVLSFNMS